MEVRRNGGSSSLGGALTLVRGPTCQIIIMIHWHIFQSSMKLLSPKYSLWYSMLLYIRVNVQ